MDYTIKRHYPDIKESDNPALELLKKVIKKQIELVTNWMRVGFVHGVMNTDNMTISGETIDYGPCAFMDNYNPETVFSSIDHHGRYAYCNQPVITKWNLARFAETLLPLINENKEKAIKIATDTVNEFDSIYKTHWINMMRKKLGLIEEKKEDENLINDLLLFMEKNKADYTNTFFSLTEKGMKENDLLKKKEFYNWHQKWKKRQSENNIKNSINLMKDSNPLVIPRNHIVEEVLKAGEKDNLLPLNSFLKILQNPYGNHKNILKYQSPPPPSNDLYRTFCGT